MKKGKSFGQQQSGLSLLHLQHIHLPYPLHSLLQLLITFRNSQMFHSLPVLFSRTADVDQLLDIVDNILLLRCIVGSMPA